MEEHNQKCTFKEGFFIFNLLFHFFDLYFIPILIFILEGNPSEQPQVVFFADLWDRKQRIEAETTPILLIFDHSKSYINIYHLIITWKAMMGSTRMPSDIVVDDGNWGA